MFLFFFFFFSCLPSFLQVFCDFGEEFLVHDTNGENPVSVMVASITSEEKSVVMCLDEHRHGFESGDYVTFSEVQGMEGLNGSEPREVEVLGPYSFSIGDTRGLGEYVRGGIATQVKMPKAVKFKSLRQSLLEPECLISDFAKMERPQQLHVAFQAVDAFRTETGRLPLPGNADDGARVVALAKDISAQTLKVDIDDKLVAAVASQATGDLVAMTGVIGSIAAQEVMKACSGKFNPIFQYLYFDSLECLPEDGSPVPPEQLQPVGSRYDAQIAVFGTDFQAKLANARYFIVGAGAIGCELLKYFAMIGLACGPEVGSERKRRRRRRRKKKTMTTTKEKGGIEAKGVVRCLCVVLPRPILIIVIFFLLLLLSFRVNCG